MVIQIDRNIIKSHRNFEPFESGIWFVAVCNEQ